jgi:hypothetical protein
MEERFIIRQIKRKQKILSDEGQLSKKTLERVTLDKKRIKTGRLKRRLSNRK